MQLRTLVEKNPDTDLLREMIGFTAQRLMELEVGALAGAAYGEKTRASGAAQWLPGSRLGDPSRHGELRIPNCAEAPIFPAFSSRAGC